ncbi:MAG: AraC family transcriptional regulator, partial [Oscillospiraceae bacterium]
VSHPQKMRINQTLDEELADPHLINSDKYIVSEDYNGQKSLTTVLDSYYSGIKYISVNNYNLIMKEVMVLKNVIYWSVLILLIFGFFVSYYSAKKLYLPIQMIINKITSKKNTAFDMNKNELSAIGDVIADMFQKEEYLNDFFEWNKNNIRQSSIRQMFFGELKTRQEYADIGITFDKTCYMAIIVWHKELPENYHYKIIIEETFEEKLSENYRCYGVPDEKNTIAFILNFDGNDQLEEIETTLRTLLLEIKNLISNNIIITLGDITVSLNDVKRSYIAAKEALRYKIFVSGGIIPAWQFANVQTTNYNPKREMQKLISAIQFQEHEEVQVAANELFATLTNRMDISCENVEAIYIDLYKELITIMETHNIDPKDIGEMDFKLNEFLENSYIVETNQYFTQMAHKINENLRADADKDQKFAKQIAEYIRRNYTEDIEVSKLSEEIGISYSHLRRIFRDNMKTNLTSYINELRIEDAKGLLMETDLTVAEISQRLGYNNEQSLRRYFNKIVGTTPGKFRSSQN